MNGTRPAASLSLDLDNQWSYMKTHGDPDWVSLPSYLDIVIPRSLELLDRQRLKVTVFVVGQDAAQPRHRDVLRAIAQQGHEIANHSFHHEPWLHLYTEEQVEEEILAAELALRDATGVHPIGFRGPGYSMSEAVLATLARRGYLYDASTLPTFIGPVARAYYFMTAKLTAEQRAERKLLFGRLRDGLRPIRPYYWKLGQHQLLEIPVTTMPGVRVPIHLSYVLYLALYSKAAALFYFRSAMMVCRLMGVEPSLLLHPLDFLGRTEAPPLDFFPAMQMPLPTKLDLLRRALGIVEELFDIVPMAEHARRIRASQKIATMELRCLTS